MERRSRIASLLWPAVAIVATGLLSAEGSRRSIAVSQSAQGVDQRRPRSPAEEDDPALDDTSRDPLGDLGSLTERRPLRQIARTPRTPLAARHRTRWPRRMPRPRRSRVAGKLASLEQGLPGKRLMDGEESLDAALWETEGAQLGHNTCYLAAALQVIFRTPALANFVTDASNLRSRFDPQLLVETLSALRPDHETTLLESRALSAPSLDAARAALIAAGVIPRASQETQEDAGDLIMKILDRFDPQKVPGLSTPITETYAGTFEQIIELHQIVQLGVGQLSGFAEPQSVKPGVRGVPVIGLGNDEAGDLESALGRWEFIEGATCRLVKTSWRIDSSDIVMFNIDRHYFADGRYQKSEIPLWLTGTGGIELPVHEANGRVWKPFQLHACTAYTGHGVSGHWVALARLPLRRSFASEGPAVLQWYRFDGRDATLLDDSHAISLCSTAGSFVVFQASPPVVAAAAAATKAPPALTDVSNSVA